MTSTTQVIEQFYSAFQKKDFRTMQDCYADKATFSDPVFHDLNAQEVRAMWEMLCLRGKDLEIEFMDVKANEAEGSAVWIARYTFSSTGRYVANHINARFKFENGKIVEHTDHFNFHRWAGQALGLSGRLLGWTPFFKNKVQKSAMAALNDFIRKKISNK